MSLNCVDVSSYQGTIDWAKVKAAGVKYAILRAVTKNLGTDTKFETNYKNARAAGVKVGIYVYAYATDAAYAKKEANATVKLLANRSLDLPVFYDLETSTLRTSSKSVVQTVASTFQDIIEDAGYKFGIYCDKSFYNSNSHFVGYDSDCEFWIASYGTNDGTQHTVPSISHHLCAHQYSSKGSVNGISGNVDINNWYGLKASSSTDSASTSTDTSSSSTTINKTAKWTGIVTANALNVRTWAGTSNTTVSFSPLAKNTTISVCDTVTADDGSSWYYIKYNGKYGFVSAKYISKVTSTKTASDGPAGVLKSLAGTYKTTANLHMRNGAGTSNTSMVVLPKNTEVTCEGYYTTSSGTKWLYVQAYYNNIIYKGYCSSKYLNKQ